MNRKVLVLFSVIIVYVSYLSSCSSPVNPKKKISVEITNESCSFISKITSSFFTGAASSILENITDGNAPEIIDNNSNLVPGYWCECFTYYVSKDLMENYTIEELREIKGDNIKKVIILTKLFQAHQEEIKLCITSTTNDKIKNYADFERKLNKRLKVKNQ